MRYFRGELNDELAKKVESDFKNVHPAVPIIIDSYYKIKEEVEGKIKSVFSDDEIDYLRKISLSKELEYKSSFIPDITIIEINENKDSGGVNPINLKMKIMSLSRYEHHFLKLMIIKRG